MKKGEINLPLIIIAILSILVIVGLAYILFTKPFESSKNIGESTISLNINNVYEENGNLVVDVVRNPGKGELTGIKFVLSAGGNYIESLTQNSNLQELGEESFVLTPTQLSLSEIKNIFIVPIFESSDKKEVVGKITDQYSFSYSENIPVNELGNNISNENTSEVCIPHCIGLQCGLDPICGQLCGTCSGTDRCLNSTCVSQNCVPRSNSVTCGAAKCGTKTNNCGQQVNCGSCLLGQTCSQGICIQESPITTQNCKSGEDCVLLIVKNSLLPELQSDLDIWKQDIKDEYNYNTIQKAISAETPQEIKNFIKTQSNLGNLKGILLVGNIPTVFTDLCLKEYGYCPSDHYYTDLDNSCVSMTKTGTRCDGHICNEITYYTSSDEYRCSNFKSMVPEFWIARLTTPNAQGNNMTLLSAYFKRNHDYRTGKKLYEHKMLAYTPIVDSDFPSEVENSRIVFLNQGSSVEKLNYYSGEVNLIPDPSEFGEISNIYSEELKKPYEYVLYDGHGNPTSQQGMLSDELMKIKPKSLFYELMSCSVGDFTADNYLAGNYLFDGDGLMVIAGTIPLSAVVQFPATESFKLDNGFNYFESLFDNGFTVHFFGDPTLRLTKRTNSNVEMTNVNLGQMQINVNDFYYKYFNITIKNLGNEKIRLLKVKEETNSNQMITSYLQINNNLSKPISLEPNEERKFQSRLLIYPGTLQPERFVINYTFYSNAKNYIQNFSVSGELVS